MFLLNFSTICEFVFNFIFSNESLLVFVPTNLLLTIGSLTKLYVTVRLRRLFL